MSHALKRAFDIAFSASALVFLSLFLVMIGLLIKADTRGPMFFRQVRAGKGGKQFLIWKYRTMVDGAVNQGLGFRTAANDSRITRVGAFLRKYSIDEFPQLINVLKGDMSMIGPRPTLTHQVEQYDVEQFRRMDMKPGISSWASVNGRNRISWDERIELDVWYVRNWSLWLDFKTFLKTFWVAFITQDGVYAEGVNEDFASPAFERADNEPVRSEHKTVSDVPVTTERD